MITGVVTMLFFGTGSSTLVILLCMSGEKYEGWKEGVQAEIVLHLSSTLQRASYGTKLTVTSTLLSPLH